MFFRNNKDSIKEIQDAIKATRTEEINKVESIYDNINIAKQTINASAEIDFQNMDIFSIERTISSNKPRTVIGHWVIVDGCKKTHEWLLYCNIDTHERLILEFKEHKKLKNLKSNGNLSS